MGNSKKSCYIYVTSKWESLHWFHFHFVQTPVSPVSPSLSLLHRMIPPSSKNFLVNNLAAGTQYDLCVLAIYDDVITSLTATRVVGCVQFTTESEYMRCHFMQSQFLGGTMIIIIGGIIVASVLVFIIILMIRYKVGPCVQPDRRGNKRWDVSTVRSWRVFFRWW